MGRTEIDGDQVQDETITGDDVKDGTITEDDILANSIRHSHLNLNDGTNPHGTTKVDVGLGNADNTSDVDKPVSTAQQTALDLKTDKATLTTKGDIYVRDASAPQRLGIGANTFALIADTVSAVGMAWKQLLAEWVSFDPTGLLNFEPTDTNVKLALERFGNQSVSDLTEAEGNTSAAQESTTSNGWVSKSGYPFLSTDVKTAGEFSLRWSSEVGQTTKNRNYGLRTRWRPEGGTWVTLGEVQLSNARDDNFIMQSGFKEVTLVTDAKIEVDIQHGQTTNGGSSLLKNASMEIRRIGDT